MERYLIDTNIICDYFSDSLGREVMIFMDRVVDSIPVISIISQIELLSWKTEDYIEKTIKEFIHDSVVIDISEEALNICVKIRRNYKTKTPDAIIAGTALALDLFLITNDTRDFSKIPELKLINPYSL